MDLASGAAPARRCRSTRRSASPGPGTVAAVRLVTWNVNSLKARLRRVEEWLATVQPDVLCLQETKLADDAFPAHGLPGARLRVAPTTARAAGTASPSSARSASPTSCPASATATTPTPRPACCGRPAAACASSPSTCPTGAPSTRTTTSTSCAGWSASGRCIDRPLTTRPTRSCSCGDFNIAPDDRDVYDPAEFVGATHTSEPERAALARARADWGLVDVFREHYDAGGLFSWWDYRAGNFHKGKGMRIDLVLATKALADRSTVGR